MGYQRKKKFLISFADGRHEGLEVWARGASVAGTLAIIDVVGVFEEGKQLTPAEMKTMDRLFRALGGCPEGCSAAHDELTEYGLAHYENRLISWNLEDDDGRPVPANYAGLTAQDLEFAMELAMSWMDGVVGTPGPLASDSNDGGRQVEDSIPMAAL